MSAPGFIGEFFFFLSPKYKFTPACYASYFFDHLSIYESSCAFFFITALQQVTPPVLCVMRDFRLRRAVDENCALLTDESNKFSNS